MMTPEQYLALLTMHGTIMVFMVLTTAPQSGFGNYFLPIQIGAADMAFPVLNMLSFWTTFVSLVVMVSAFFVEEGAPISGWTAYTPLSALGKIVGPGEGAGQTLWVIGLAIFCAASLMGALNFIATLIDLRAQGHFVDAHAADDAGRGWLRQFWDCWRSECCSRLALCCCWIEWRGRASLFLADWWSRIRSSATLGRVAAAVATLILVLRAS